MLSNTDIKNFDKAVESLRQYRRYELVDEKNRDLLDDLYTDPLQNDAILNLCLKDNTTILIGRKGTGKSTIFMRMQNELRKKDDVITCYMDVKNIFERAKKNYSTISYLGSSQKKDIEIYSIQRKFMIDFITELIKEIEKVYNSFWEKLKSNLGFSKKINAIERLREIKNKIADNKHLKEIELQTLKEVSYKVNSTDDNNITAGLDISCNTGVGKGLFNTKVNSSTEYKNSCTEGMEKKYNRVFARIFEITTIIDEIKNVLEELKLKKLYIILDDYSEIEQTALRMFCDLIINTLNNNSDNFIRLKISAYPGRVELGELDRQKIDIRYLDYYHLYSYDKRSDMELSAINYTERIINRRLKIYTKKEMSDFFDMSKGSKEEYCRLIFEATLNVVRHIGLILDYAKETSLDQNDLISMSDLKDAAKRLYNERLKLFFKENESALMSYEDRIERFQLEDLLKNIINKAKKVKKEIRTEVYTAKIFNKNRKNPHCSHFYISQKHEELLSTLELNFFLSKYNEMVSKTGEKVSIFSLNYGLALSENIKWGKPEGSEHRTYFIESPFNYNQVFENFIVSTKKIICTNPECGHIFEISELENLKKYNMRCFLCGKVNSVIIESLDEKYTEKLEQEKKSKNSVLEPELITFMSIFKSKDGMASANEMAKEMNVTVQKIGWWTKLLEEKHKYIKKENRENRRYYRITALGNEFN